MGLASAALLIGSSVAFHGAEWVLSASTLHPGRLTLLLLGAAVALCSSLGIEVLGHWRSGFRPESSSYAAMVYLAAALQLELVVTLVAMAFYTLARLAVGRLDGVRRVTFDSLGLLWHYSVCQGLLGLLLVHGFPRLIG